MVTGVFAVAGVVAGLVLTNLSNESARTAGQILLATITAITEVVKAVTTFKVIFNSLATLGFRTAELAPQLALQVTFALNSTVGKLAAVGAVIGLIVTWSLFFAAWARAASPPIASSSIVWWPAP